MEDLQAFQDQRYGLYSSGHLRPPDNRTQERQRADHSTRRGTRPSSQCRNSQMRSLWRNLYFRQLEKSDQHKQLVACYIQDTVRSSEPKGYTESKRMVTRHLEHKIREKHLSTRDRVGENLTLLFSQSQEKERGRGRRLQSTGLQKVNVPEDRLAVSIIIRLRNGSIKKSTTFSETQISRYG